MGLLVVSVGTYAVYVAIVLGRADGTAMAEVSYVAPVLWTIGISIALSIAGHIAVAIAKPSEADKSDVRNRDINRFGQYIGGMVLAVGMLVPFGPALVRADHSGSPARCTPHSSGRGWSARQ